MTTSELITLEIPRHLNDQRIDSALRLLLEEKMPEANRLSRAVLTRLIEEGVVLCNGKRVLPRALVATHDVLSFPADIFSKKASLTPSDKKIDLQVLFENEHFLVLDKGPGVQMHQGGSYEDGTVAEWLLYHYPGLAAVGDDVLRPGIVHRLDRDTSGVIVVAKDNETFQTLRQAFQDREVGKTYVALVYGHLPALSGEISASLMRRPGELKRRAVDPHTYTGTLPGNTRTALTLYRVLMRYDEYDLVELTPKTGRTHQLRVHLSYLGHPVVGDKLYGFKEVKRKKLLAPARQLLHAAAISFSLGGEEYHFRSPLPEDFRTVIDMLDPAPFQGEISDYL